MGEHSVVYGQPAIALPVPKIDLNVRIMEKQNGIYINSKYFIGNLNNVPNDLLGIKKLN